MDVTSLPFNSYPSSPIPHGKGKNKSGMKAWDLVFVAYSSSQVCCSMSSSNCSNFPQFIVIHTVKGFAIVNKAEIDVFLELSCFFNDPADVGTLIFGSSDFSKTSLNTWKFTVHILLKPAFENCEHYFIKVWDECNYPVVWAFFGIAFLWDCNEKWLFQSCGHWWVSKFAGILSAALSQHHFSGFEIAQLEFYHLH